MNKFDSASDAAGQDDHPRLNDDAKSQRLIHELQVHQVELKLQNHALLETCEQLEQSLKDYTELYDFAPVSYFTLGADGKIRKVNLTGATLLVARAGNHPMRELEQTIKRLAQAGVQVKGFVFNDLDVNRLRYRYGYKGYVYRYSYKKS